MKCTAGKSGDITFIVCGGRARRKFCKTPGCDGEAKFECDFAVTRSGGKAGTCDRLMCEKCRTDVEGRDLCPPHAGMVKRVQG